MRKRQIYPHDENAEGYFIFKIRIEMVINCKAKTPVSLEKSGFFLFCHIFWLLT